MAGVRLDHWLVGHGLAASRERARALILAGEVLVDGVPASKAGHLILVSQRRFTEFPLSIGVKLYSHERCSWSRRLMRSRATAQSTGSTVPSAKS